MEKESFEDEETAKHMNDVFVSIKVDREERPDIDNIYMLACQMLNDNGGWSLSIIMTPDKKPFFAGTYFPKESGYGRIGFKDLIRNVNSAWKEKQNEITESVNHISFSLSQVQSKTEKVQIDEKHLETAFNCKYYSIKYSPVKKLIFSIFSLVTEVTQNKINVIPAFFSFCHSRVTLLVRHFLRRSGNPLLILFLSIIPEFFSFCHSRRLLSGIYINVIPESFYRESILTSFPKAFIGNLY